MEFIVSGSNGSGEFKRVPSGVYIGRCYSLIDLGTQISSGQFGEKAQHKISLSWELFGEDEQGNPLTVEIDGKQMPMTIRKRYTCSLHEKSNLRHDLAAWRGRDFTEEELKAFDMGKLVGAYCMVNVTQSENNGKTYSNIAGLTPIPVALKNAKPEAVHAPAVFSLSKPDMALFATFHEKLQDTIKASPEWQAHSRATPAPDTATQANGSGFDDIDSDIPF